jgi:heat shock protein HtpX
MSEPILSHARNILEQQTHNRRMTWLLIVAFIFLIAAIGAGFDVFLNIGSMARIIILPFVLLMIASGIWNFQKRAAEGLWKKPQAFADDEDDLDMLWWAMRIIGGPVIFFMVFLDTRPLQHFAELFDIPLLLSLPIGTILVVIMCILSIVTSLYWGMNSVLWSVQAKRFDDQLDYAPELINVVKEMSLAAGIPNPSVYIVKDSNPNAFAIGTDPMDSSIVVTTGLLTMLDREELQGVIAHEMSHIRNSDTRLMTTITVLFGAVLLLSEWMKKSALLGGFAGGRIPGAGWILRGVFFVGWILTLLVAPLIARIVAMAVSRQREFLADAGGAELTRNPKALAKALMKIEHAAKPLTSFQKSIAHLCIVDPLGRKVNMREGWWANLLATHPPMKNRILLLNAMAYQKI